MNNRTSELRLRAPAKINLGLEVLRRRTDGYHDINTIFATIDLADELTLRRNNDGKIHCRVIGNETLEGDPDNLCVRAAEMVRRSRGTAEGLDIALTKHIPIGAGLGGGSSDAAATLDGAASIWGVGLEAGERAKMALALGSDVPFFLEGGVAHASGQGEKLSPLPVELDYEIVLVNPGIHLPTPWAYGAIGRNEEREASDLVATLQAGISDPAILREHLVNDFEPAVFREWPLLAELKKELYDAGALFALMSGSGSTLFGLFPPDRSAREAATRFDRYWSTVTRFAPLSATPPPPPSAAPAKAPESE